MLGPRLLRRSLASLTQKSRAAVLGEPPPDVTISTGHRSVAVVQWLRHRSRDRLRAIHVGFPRVSPANFDLVVATPQYPVADHSNLLRIPYAITRAAAGAAPGIDDDELANFPAPRRLLMVGGPTLFWDVDRSKVAGVLRRLIDAAGEQGGSVLVSTSPRTRPKLKATLASMLSSSNAPNLLAAPGQAPSYGALLAAADSIHVTADSVAMVSDAIWTGKPIALVPIAETTIGGALIGVMDRLRPGRPLYPRDLRRFWKALAGIGVTEKLATPRRASDEQLCEVVDRARAIINSLVSGENGGRGKD